MNARGTLENRFLHDEILPGVQRVSAMFTDLKFKVRGPIAPKNKVIVLAVDDASLDMLGRWPWSREKTAAAIDAALQFGAKTVGLDIVFSEPDIRVPTALVEELKGKRLDDIASKYET